GGEGAWPPPLGADRVFGKNFKITAPMPGRDPLDGRAGTRKRRGKALEPATGTGAAERWESGRAADPRLSTSRHSIDLQFARLGLGIAKYLASVLGETDEALHEGHDIREFVILVDLQGRLDQRAGEEHDRLRACPGDRDVESVEAVDELFLVHRRLDVRDPVADDDGLAFLALYAVDRVDKGLSLPIAGGVQRASDCRDLHMMRADDE